MIIWRSDHGLFDHGTSLLHFTDDNISRSSGSPVSLAGKDYLVEYFKEFDLEIGEMKNMSCRQAFCFGSAKRYISLKMIEVARCG